MASARGPSQLAMSDAAGNGRRPRIHYAVRDVGRGTSGMTAASLAMPTRAHRPLPVPVVRGPGQYQGMAHRHAAVRLPAATGCQPPSPFAIDATRRMKQLVT